jgi:hypothetical protein
VQGAKDEAECQRDLELEHARMMEEVERQTGKQGWPSFTR